MKIYCCQLEIAWENKAANFDRVRTMIGREHPEPGGLLVLPEMFATGFSMNTSQIVESAGGETERFLTGIAREFGLFVVGGLPVRNGDGTAHNQCLAVSPEGTVLVRYSKIHPFALGGESECYARGQEIQSFNWGGFEVVPFICYDLRFPEIFRNAVREAAEMFIVIANWPSKRERHWVTLLQARAIENLAYVIGVNRAGRDPKFSYPGRSLIVDPHGEILADAGSPEGMISAEVQRSTVTDWRRDFPALQDMHWPH